MSYLFKLVVPHESVGTSLRRFGRYSHALLGSGGPLLGSCTAPTARCYQRPTSPSLLAMPLASLPPSAGGFAAAGAVRGVPWASTAVRASAHGGWGSSRLCSLTFFSTIF